MLCISTIFATFVGDKLLIILKFTNMEQNTYPQPPEFNQQAQQPQYPQQPYPGVPLVKPQMRFVEAIKTVLIKKYCCFKGRARRSEYWTWVLAYFLLSFVLSMLNMFIMVSRMEVMDPGDPLSFYMSPGYILLALVGLALFLPNLGVTVRRLHDTNRSGWWAVAPIVLYVPLYIAMLAMIKNGGDNFMSIMVIFGLLSLVALAYCIIMLVWLCQDSDPQPNKYGPSPKYN